MPAVKSYILKNSGDLENAKDIFHDALLNVVLKVKEGKLNDQTDVKGYLFMTAKNLWVTKKRRDRKVTYTDVIGDESGENTTAEVMEGQEKVRFMEEVLTSLGEKCKQLLKLTFYKDHSLKEAASIMGLSSDEVAKTTQYRCKKKLFNLVKDDQRFRSLMEI